MIKAYIFGAGKTGKEVLDKIKLQNKYEVIAFLDNFTNDKTFVGLNIIKIDRNVLLQKDMHVIIASIMPESIKSIKNKLLEINFPPENIKTLKELKLIKQYSGLELKRLKKLKKLIIKNNNVFSKILECRKLNDFHSLKKYNKVRGLNKNNEYLEGLNFSKYKIILDLGTFDGFQADLFSKLSEYNCEVHSFDPFGTKYVKKKYLNNKSIHFIGAAITNYVGNIYFREYGKEEAEGSYITKSKSSHNSVVVNAMTIDEYVNKNKLKYLSYIKFDIEGSEVEGIQGGTDSLLAFKPDLSISVYHKPSHMFEIAEMVLSLVPDYKIWFNHYTDSMDGSIMYFSLNPQF